MNRRVVSTLSGMLCPILALLAPDATAAIVPVAQDRSVEASATATVFSISNSDSDSAAAADFAPFAATVDPLAVTVAEVQVAISQGVARQDSSLGAASVSASGEASAALTLTAGGNGSASADAASLFEFLFFVDSASSFLLTGSLDTQAIVTGGAAIPLLLNDLLFEDVDNSVVLFQALTNDESFSVNGLLQPGSYRLSASARIAADQASSLVAARTVSGLSSYEFVLDVVPVPVPEPAVPALLLLSLAGLGIAGSLSGARRGGARC